MTKINAILLAFLFGYCFDPHTEHTMPQNDKLVTSTTVDGPYVLYRNDSVLVNYITDSAGVKSVRTEGFLAANKKDITLQVNTDVSGKTFPVQLKEKLANEKPEYRNVPKMLVISDIEGNFEALRKLLIVSQVIDEDLNWIFGKDHVVFTGDFVDRGNMVTEVLWFIYMLEEKAKAAGGYVHYVLGNHEIMNMSNDLAYVHGRYLQHAQLMNTYYTDLFGPNAELGRWLATKNVVERVGNVLFAHGGISAYMNMLSIPLKELNDLTRKYYTDTTYKYSDDRLDVIYSDFGPFWYRNYYKAPRASVEQIDSTLDIYKVKHIATGHTIIANEIRSLYGGKVYDTDVHHADGHSEALLIDNGKFTRITIKGERLEVKPI